MLKLSSIKFKKYELVRFYSYGLKYKEMCDDSYEDYVEQDSLQVKIDPKAVLRSRLVTSFKLPTVELKTLPVLTNFNAFKESFARMANKEWCASVDIGNNFREIFPGVIQTDFEQDRNDRTDVKIELDNEVIKASKNFDLVAIGDACSLSAAYLYKLRYPNKSVLHTASNRAYEYQITSNQSQISINLNPLNMLMNTFIRKPNDSDIRNLLEHSKKAHEITDAISKIEDIPKEAFLIKDKVIAEESIDKIILPKDGLISPKIVENLTELFKFKGGLTEDNLKLEKIYVKRENEEAKVTKIQFNNLMTNEKLVYGVDSIVFSLGTTGVFSAKAPEYSIIKHLSDLINGSTNSPSYSPTVLSLFRHVLNEVKKLSFSGDKIFKPFAWISTVNIILMVRIDLDKAPKSESDPFTRPSNLLNQQQVTLISTRDVHSNGKRYRYHAIQMNGTKPDELLTKLNSFEKLFNLKNKDYLEYDVIQSNNYRTVNSIKFAPLANNAVGSYASKSSVIEQITLFPNSELLVQLLEALKKNGPGNIKSGQIGNMDKQMEIYGKNIFDGINYNSMINDKEKLARIMGFNQTFDLKEIVFSFTLLFSLFLYLI